MARTFSNVGIPTDEPKILRPGVMLKESDFHGNAKHLALPPEHPERANKGDLGLNIIPGLESKPLSYSDLPFTIKK
jgi:hypothetical protein